MAVIEQRARPSGRGTNPETLVDTALNSLANNGAATGPAISNDGTAELDLEVDFELVLASLTPGTGPYIEVWCLPTIDSTNYPDTGILLCTIPVTTGTGAKRETTQSYRVPIKDHKWKVVSRLGVAMGSSGNTLKGFYSSGGSGS